MPRNNSDDSARLLDAARRGSDTSREEREKERRMRRIEREIRQSDAEIDRKSVEAGNPSAGLPITVRTRGQFDPYETARISVNNYADALSAERKKNAEEKEFRRQEDITRASQALADRSQAYAKGGLVKKKSAKGSSVRGGGVALRGVGKGKVY